MNGRLSAFSKDSFEFILDITACRAVSYTHLDVYKRQIQHIAGMENSECVIAINKNDTAAIFEVSDLGIVGDVKVIIPKLAEALEKYKAENN